MNSSKKGTTMTIRQPPERTDLIYVTCIYGHRYRISKQDLDNPAKIQLPLFNQFGQRLSQNPKYKVANPVTIHRNNLNLWYEYKCNNCSKTIAANKLNLSVLYCIERQCTTINATMTPTGRTFLTAEDWRNSP